MQSNQVTLFITILIERAQSETVRELFLKRSNLYLIQCEEIPKFQLPKFTRLAGKYNDGLLSSLSVNPHVDL